MRDEIMMAGRGQATIEAAERTVSGAEPRMAALDGFRGLMTLFVLVSHYFAEVPHGIPGLAVGWLAVVAFFVLSGFLVGRLILERKDCANFFTVFYARRLARTLPVYLVCVTLVFGCLVWFSQADWLNIHSMVPLWAYLTFTQGFFFVASDSFGPHWLAPTWTLAVEEQFYLFAPVLFFVVPRRHLLKVLAGGLMATVAFRAYVLTTGALPALTTTVMLPGIADTLICGLIAGLLIKTDGIDWKRFDLALRVIPVAMLLATNVLIRLDGGVEGPAFQIFARLLVSIAAASFLLAMVRGAPEAKRFASPVLRFFGRTSYSVYMTHLAVLGLMHGLLLGGRPDLASPAQIAVTLAALPVAVLVGWIGTKLVEEPITAYGRSWMWSKEERPRTRPFAGDAVPA
jgi:peptidoglycan/LPS O-acetylase OafA/YrhL